MASGPGYLLQFSNLSAIIGAIMWPVDLVICCIKFSNLSAIIGAIMWLVDLVICCIKFSNLSAIIGAIMWLVDLVICCIKLSNFSAIIGAIKWPVDLVICCKGGPTPETNEIVTLICSCHNFFFPFFCANTFYTSLLLIVCALK